MILSKYKASTRAANVTKEVFIIMSAKPPLCRISVSWTHNSRFQSIWLHPINTKTIPSNKIAPYIANTSTESRKISSSCSVVKVTPLHTEDNCKPLPNAPKDKKKKVKLHMEGTTLSNEEVMEY